MSMPRFLTLGPGTNHELVARAYLDFHDVDQEQLGFFANPDEGVAKVKAGEADFLILCSVHPDAARITAHDFRHFFILDTFISPSKTLAVLTRKDAARPRSLALFGPTRDYVDTSRWEEVIVETSGSIVTVADRILAGGCDSALLYLEYADRHPGFFEVTEVIGSPDDAWLVFGTRRASTGGVVACRDSLVARAVSDAARASPAGER
jgi:hypothetical protein